MTELNPFNFIIDPLSGARMSLFSSGGKAILQNLVKNYKSGGVNCNRKCKSIKQKIKEILEDKSDNKLYDAFVGNNSHLWGLSKEAVQSKDRYVAENKVKQNREFVVKRLKDLKNIFDEKDKPDTLSNKVNKYITKYDIDALTTDILIIQTPDLFVEGTVQNMQMQRRKLVIDLFEKAEKMTDDQRMNIGVILENL